MKRRSCLEPAEQTAAEAAATVAASAGTVAGAAGAATLGRDLRLQVLHSIIDIASVGQVARSNEQRTATDAVRGVAVSLRLLRREVGDLSAFLTVASVAVKHHTSNPVLNAGVELRHGVHHHGGALGVAGGHDDGVGALLCRLFEKTHGFLVGATSGAARQGVGAHASPVGASNALAGDVVVVGLLEAVAGGWADGGTLNMFC